MDGKQARLTKNSTVLGMLFDHGCDCLTVFLYGSILVSILRGNYFNYGFLILIQIVSIFIGVYCTMME